jgi:hypothetical protein
VIVKYNLQYNGLLKRGIGYNRIQIPERVHFHREGRRLHLLPQYNSNDMYLLLDSRLHVVGARDEM